MVNTLIDSACHYLEITAFKLQGRRAEDCIYGWAVTAITDDGLHFIMAKFSKQELAERFRDSMNALLQKIKEKGQ